jgi:hypothetical protein
MQTFQCSPYPACTCMLWEVRPGETVPMPIDWTGFLASVDGYNLSSIESAAISNMMVSPPAPADDAEIELVSGLATDPASSWPGFTRIMGDGRLTVNMIKTGPDIPGGKVFRFDISVGFTDCNGVKSVVNECVSISVRAGH